MFTQTPSQKSVSSFQVNAPIVQSHPNSTPKPTSVPRSQTPYPEASKSSDTILIQLQKQVNDLATQINSLNQNVLQQNQQLAQLVSTLSKPTTFPNHSSVAPPPSVHPFQPTVGTQDKSMAAIPISKTPQHYQIPSSQGLK